MLKYKVNNKWSDAKITEVEFVRETDKCFWTLETNYSGKAKERKHAKSSDYESYFDTWEFAHAALLERADREVEYARSRLKEAHDFAGNVKGMKKPA